MIGLSEDSLKQHTNDGWQLIDNALAEAMVGQAIRYFGLDGLICQRSQPKAA